MVMIGAAMTKQHGRIGKGYAMAELNSGRLFKAKGSPLPVNTVGITRDPIVTIGGLLFTI
jgi:hypothetical protein